MICMAKKTGKRGRPRIEREPLRILQARVTPQVYDALARLARDSHRSIASELVVALEAWLRQHGRFPAPLPDDA